MFRFGKRQVIRCQRRWSSTVTGGFDLFGNEGQAADYAVYRPQYSANVFSLIHQTLPLERKMALDIGTGTGQVAVPLRTKLGFERVIGIDQSSEQLSHAKPQEGVEYKVGDAYSLDLPDNSASLITIAQALHWLDLDRFFKEVKRVLVEGGTLAVMGYSIPEVLHEKIGVLKRQFYFDTLGSHLPVGSEGCYWDCDRHLVDSGFGEVQLFEEEFKSVDRHWIYEEEEAQPRNGTSGGPTGRIPGISAEDS
ncbi:hypothetical protein AAMO2058_000500000 [Amorphochlora amoebiformis]